jgi:outer membrane lipoprotein-sorting protein
VQVPNEDTEEQANNEDTQGESTPPAAENPAPQEPQNKVEQIMARLANVKNISYEFNLSEPGSSSQGWGKVWVSGKKVRQDLNTQDGSIITTMYDGETKVGYMLMASEKMAIKSDFYGGFALPATPDAAPQDIESEAKQIGTESIEGARCLVFEYDAGLGAKSRYWLREDIGMMVKAEYEVTINGQTSKGGIAFTNISLAPIPDSLFQVPSDYTVMGQ